MVNTSTVITSEHVVVNNIEAESIVVTGAPPGDPVIKTFPSVPTQIADSDGVAILNRINVVNSATKLNFTLPENPQDSDRLGFYAYNNLWSLNQDKAQQQVTVGAKKTTLGLQGKIESLAIGDFLMLIYVDNTWVKENLQGQVDIR